MSKLIWQRCEEDLRESRLSTRRGEDTRGRGAALTAVERPCGPTFGDQTMQKEAAKPDSVSHPHVSAGRGRSASSCVSERRWAELESHHLVVFFPVGGALNQCSACHAPNPGMVLTPAGHRTEGVVPALKQNEMGNRFSALQSLYQQHLAL